MLVVSLLDHVGSVMLAVCSADDVESVWSRRRDVGFLVDSRRRMADGMAG
jgi:hypothetical protein